MLDAQLRALTSDREVEEPNFPCIMALEGCCLAAALFIEGGTDSFMSRTVK